MCDKNLNIILKEINELHRQQQESVALISNKLNWILVSDIVFLTACSNKGKGSIWTIYFVFISILFAIFGLRPKKFKWTAKIVTMLKEKNNSKFLNDLILKKKELFDSNIKNEKEMQDFLLLSKIMLAIGLGIEFVLIINKI